MTANRGPSPAVRWIGAVALGLVGSTAAAWALARLVPDSNLRAAFEAFPLPVIAVIAAPFLATMIAAAFVSMGQREPAPAGRDRPNDAREAVADHAPPPAASDDAALHLLALLQQEGRFVDFLQESLAPYADDQIGAAVRSIHEGCRSALRERVELAPILPGEEGAPVTVDRGFDPAAIRVTGNVRGEPPYRGVLRHPGWRTTGGLKLPTRAANHDVSILAPAEVEIP